MLAGTAVGPCVPPSQPATNPRTVKSSICVPLRARGDDTTAEVRCRKTMVHSLLQPPARTIGSFPGTRPGREGRMLLSITRYNDQEADFERPWWQWHGGLGGRDGQV